LPRAFPRETAGAHQQAHPGGVETEVGPKQSVRVIVREIPLTHWAAPDETLAERAQKRHQQNS
jgi:hypothetical protein